MDCRLAIASLAIAGLLLTGCVSSGHSCERADSDGGVVDRLLHEAAVLREEGEHESSWAAVAMALRIDPENTSANEMWAEVEQDRFLQVQQCLREARQFQLDRRYGESLLALGRAQQLDPDNPAVEAFADIMVDVNDAYAHKVIDERGSATTESGTGIRWGMYASPVQTVDELQTAISREIPQHAVLEYCEQNTPESTNERIYVPHLSMPFSLEDSARLRGRLFEDDGSLGEIHWYAYSCYGTPIGGPVWVYVVWRDVGDERWVLKRGLVSYDLAAAPRDYVGAVPVSYEDGSYEDVTWVTTE